VSSDSTLNLKHVEARSPQPEGNVNQHYFVVVGLLTPMGPITVHLKELPYVNEVLETGPGWHGIAPGTKLRIRSINFQPEDEAPLRSLPLSMIYVVAV
jgi:hypothetical protein